jgi:7,8-dihydropterin-6-yl-methyl-4-(beta-D-ribofuranosyl)aminobenzene 5'-phosphate synthase
MKWAVLSDNRSSNPALETEHGLSILLETGCHKILLDTGASDMQFFSCGSADCHKIG